MMNIFSGSNQAIVRSFKNRLLVANELGIIKVVDLLNRDDEPEVLEVLDNLTCFELQHNLIAAVTLDGGLELYQVNRELSNVEKSIKCYRSELPLRDVVFLDDQHLAVVGDTNQLVLVDLSTIYHSGLYDWAQDLFDTGRITKIDIPDQARSVSYNDKTKMLSVTLSSGAYLFLKYTDEKGALLATAHVLYDYYGKYIYVPDDSPEVLNGVDNLARGNVAWNLADNTLAIVDKTHDIKICSDIKAQELTALTGHHKSEVLELQWCPYNYNFLASIDYDNQAIVWDIAAKRPVFNRKLNAEHCKLKNISWTAFGLDSTVVLSIGTTSGDIFTFDSIVEAAVTQQEPEKRFDFQEDDDDLELSDDDLLKDAPSGKRSRADFESDLESDISDEESDFDLGKDSTLPHYDLKPYAVGISPWHQQKRYLAINEVGSVFCERNVENNTQTISVKFSDKSKNTDYYFIDAVGYDLAYLNDEALLLASSAYADKTSVDVFGTNFNNIKEYKQAKVFYRPHKAESDSWDKMLPIKNYYKQSDKATSKEFITNICLSKRYIFVFTSYGHTRILAKFGLLLKIEKTLPVVASVANSKILFSISVDGRSFYYSIRDLVTNNHQTYIERNQPFPIDYVPAKLSDEQTSFDDLLEKFETFEKNAALDRELDVNVHKGPRHLIDVLVFKPPIYLLKGLFFNNLGDPCIVDNSNCLYVLSGWKRTAQGLFIPLLNLNEILLTRSHLNIIPLSLQDDKLSVVFFNKISHQNEAFLYPSPLPDPTEINIKIPVSLNVDMKALKEQQQAAKEADDEDFIERDDEDEDLLEDTHSEDEELHKELQKELETEEAFLRTKVMTDLINKSIESHSLFEKIITNKFKSYKRSKQILEDSNDDDYYLNDLDLNLSDHEIDTETNELRLKNPQFRIDDCIDKLQELNSIYDKSLLKMFSEFCGNQEVAKALSLVKELKQDRALIAASRIAERLEMAEVVARINEEREKRMDFD